MDELRSRTDAKRANRVLENALARLSVDLCRVNPRKLEELGLPEGLRDALVDFQSITSAPAKNRQLRLVRGELRSADWSAIQKRLAHLLEHGTVGAAAQEDPAAGVSLNAEATWVIRLLGEGGPGLDAFLLEFPRADRTHLRQLVRSVGKASHERRVKAERKLAEAVRGFLR